VARVRSFRKGVQDIRVHPSEVDCFHQVVESDLGKFVHLSTFGSDARQAAPKSSQSIQIDEAMAAELVQILKSVFPSLR